MATRGFNKFLADAITCDICGNYFAENKIPRQLPCMHVFCEDCIRHELNTAQNKNLMNPNTIKCHTCETNVEIPSGSAANLPLFFHVQKMRDILENYEQRHLVCQLCKTNTLKSGVCCYCFQCSSCLCNDCSQKHNNKFESHNCITVTASGMYHLICSDHDTHLQYYCMQCGQSVCAQCRIAKHNDHKIFELTFESGGNIYPLKNYLQQSLQLIEKSQQNLDFIQIETKRNEMEIRQKLKHFRDLLKKQADDQYMSLSAILDRKYATFNQEIRNCKQLTEEACVSVKKYLKETKNWEQPIRGVLQSRIKDIESLMAEVKEQIPSPAITVKKTLTFVPGTQKISLGQLQEHDAMPDNLVTGEVIVPVSSSVNCDTSDQDILLRCTQMKPSILHNIQTCGDRIWDMSFLHSGELVVLGRFGLKVFSATGEETSNYLREEMKSHRGVLRGICTDIKHKTVVITEHLGSSTPGHLNIYRQDGDTWVNKRKTISSQSNYVAITKSNKFVVTTTNKKLLLYDAECKRVWSKDLTQNIDGICVDHNNKIFVLLSDGAISVYEEDGTEVL